MASKEIEEAMKRIADVNEVLGKYGCSLAIIKTPREYNRSGDGGITPTSVYGNNNVRERRLAMGMTKTQLAKAMGVRNVIVYRMEKEGCQHQRVSMEKFADFFGCTVEDLLREDWQDVKN